MGETVVAAATVTKCCSLAATWEGSCCWEWEASWDRILLLDNSLDSALPDNEGSDISTDCKREPVTLLKACPGPGCQGAAGGRRLAADREIIQLNSIRVHQ